MGITSWDPLHDLAVQADDRRDSGAGDWAPRADVVEVGDRYEISLEVAGLNADAVRVTVEGGRVTLAGRRPSLTGGDVQYHRLERGQGSFIRTFAFPGPIDGSRITATARDGVVTVTVPRSAIEGARQVEIT
jgi:HSP20 family protein